MSKFKVIKTTIRGLLIIEPTDDSDTSGFVMDADSNKDLLEIGLDVEFVQENSYKVAQRGTLRGMHFQREQTQGRLIRVVSGSVVDVVIDFRPTSKTYGAYWAVGMSAENGRMLWVPEQFANGFLTIDNDTEIVIKCTDYDNPESLSGIIWDDPTVNIDWQLDRYSIDEKYMIISNRDKKLPSYGSWRPNEIWEKGSGQMKIGKNKNLSKFLS